VVLAATNRKEAIDPALLRPGRLERHVEVPVPDREGRRAILAVHTRDSPLGEAVDLDALAGETAGYSGAQIEALVREASLRAIREIAQDVAPGDAAEHADAVTIRAGHFRAAQSELEAQHTEKREE
jgi:transitional endoplasmic reticulum ATPase